MTNERAVEILNLDLDILGQYGDETAEAYKMAIKALENQQDELVECDRTSEAHPTHGSTYGGVSWGGTYKEEAQPTDAVSREAVEEITFQEPSYTDPYNILTEVREKVRALPSVKPQYTDEEIDKAQAVEQAYVDKMVELAVEETKRPKGKWIKVITNKDEWGETWHFKCSICGEKSNKGYRPLENYCHNCGAEMSGGGEDGTETR